MSTDIDALLRHADPLARVPDAALEPSLVSARQTVERRRRPQARAARWPRVLVASGALAATAAVVTLTVGPGTAGPPAPDQSSGGLLPAAVAADGQMVENPTSSSYAAPIAPKDADLRLLPAYLPPGWSYKHIAGRVETEANWQVPASLVATTASRDGTITGSLTVTGPVEAVVDSKGTSADVIDGQPARLFVFDEVPDPATYQFPTRTWWWSDAQGKQWQASTANLSPDDAQRAVQALHTDGDQIAFQAPASSSLEVVHQRQGPAYPTERRSLGLWLTLDDGQRERPVYITQAQAQVGESAGLNTSVGIQQTSINGRPAALFPVGDMEDPAVNPPAPGAPPCRWQDYLFNTDTKIMLETCGDETQVAKMLASLTNVPANDPRLATYALKK